jgi:hypothetical protein
MNRGAFVFLTLLGAVPARAENAFDLAPGQKVLPPLRYRQLAVFPVVQVATPIDKTQFLTLSEGMKTRQIEVTEAKGGASVNRVNVANRSKQPLLLLAGEIILGGQQDRILGKDTVVPAGEEMALEVFCVEHGRWSGRQRFEASGGMVEGKARARAKFDSNQGQVWSEVAKKTAALKAETSTGTYRAIASQGESALKPFRENVTGAIAKLPETRQMIGYVAAVNGHVTSVELFSQPALFAAYRDKLLDALYVSVADVAEQKNVTLPAKPDVDAFMRAAESVPEQAVIDSKAATTVENKGKEVRKSKLLIKGAHPAAPPVYQSYSNE